MNATPDPAAWGRVAEAYERGRPAHPSEVLDLLRPAGQVLDLAAGTGKLTWAGGAALADARRDRSRPPGHSCSGRSSTPCVATTPDSTTSRGADCSTHTRLSTGSPSAVCPSWRPSREEYVDYIGSVSFVAGLASEDRRRLLAQVAAVVPEGTLAVPFATRCWLTERTSQMPDQT